MGSQTLLRRWEDLAKRDQEQLSDCYPALLDRQRVPNEPAALAE